MYSASEELTPIGIGGRFKQTIVSSSTVNVGSGLTIKSISVEIEHVVLILLVIVAVTVCVFVLKGLGSSDELILLPNSLVYLILIE